MSIQNKNIEFHQVIYIKTKKFIKAFSFHKIYIEKLFLMICKVQMKKDFLNSMICQNSAANM